MTQVHGVRQSAARVPGYGDGAHGWEGMVASAVLHDAPTRRGRSEVSFRVPRGPGAVPKEPARLPLKRLGAGGR